VTLPALITVTGTIRDQNGPVAGKIVFYRSAVLFPAASADENLLIPDEIVAVVGVDGVLSQALYASNDPAASPTGWTWEVRPHFPSWKTSFSVVVPFDAPGGTISLNELAPVPPDGTGQLYALANHTHPGGGSITYGPVTAETTYGASSNSGAADSVSRSDHRHGNPALPTPAAIGASATSHNHSGTYDPVGTAAAAVAAHEAASDPHPQYLTATEGNAAYQPLDSDLTTIAGLTATAGNTIQSVGGAWASRTPSQVKATLAIAIGDVSGLQTELDQRAESIVLNLADLVPGGLAANTVIFRKTT